MPVLLGAVAVASKTAPDTQQMLSSHLSQGRTVSLTTVQLAHPVPAWIQTRRTRQMPEGSPVSSSWIAITLCHSGAIENAVPAETIGPCVYSAYPMIPICSLECEPPMWSVNSYVLLWKIVASPSPEVKKIWKRFLLGVTETISAQYEGWKKVTRGTFSTVTARVARFLCRHAPPSKSGWPLNKQKMLHDFIIRYCLYLSVTINIPITTFVEY